MRKVRYIGASDEQIRWGDNDDPRDLLKEGQLYKVEHEEVHSFHTKYSLKGIEGKFNSVCFETEDTKESQRAALGCCIGLLLSIPIWICIVVILIKVF